MKTLYFQENSTDPSPETDIKCFRSFVNRRPVTISEWPKTEATHSPLKKSNTQIDLSLTLVAA